MGESLDTNRPMMQRISPENRENQPHRCKRLRFASLIVFFNTFRPRRFC